MTPSLTQRKSVNLVPRAHVSFGQCLGAEQKTRGLWEGDYAKASECVWKTHLSHFYVLHTTMKFEISVFLQSIFYGKQTLVKKKAEEEFMEKQQWKELAKQRFFPAMQA